MTSPLGAFSSLLPDPGHTQTPHRALWGRYDHRPTQMKKLGLTEVENVPQGAQLVGGEAALVPVRSQAGP